jgi:serine/threonine protein phosphatase 1
MISKALGWLFGDRRQEPASGAKPPPESRIYAVGDIHGRADLLADLYAMIRADARSAPRRRVIVHLGDYIDRGLQSKEVVDLLLAPPLEGFESVCLKGNHEQVLMDFLADPRVGPHWLKYGGDATLSSYGVPVLELATGEIDCEAVRQACAQRLPPRHLAFFCALPASHAEGGYFFAHAGVRPKIALDQQSADDLMWIRHEFLKFTGSFGAVVVHGHHITSWPDMRSNRIGIDTGAYASGRLTCLVLEGEERRFLST